jgi:signal transduction histidine kinase
MTQTGKQRLDVRTSRQLVLVAFAVVCAGVLIITAFTMAQIRALEKRARDVVENMLTSVRLVGELASEVKTKQILVNEHILASEPEERARLEARIATVEAQIAATIRAYQRWVTLPGEQATWDQTRNDLKDLEGPIARVVALSRENLDTEARWVMEGAADQFARVSQDFDRLISINNAGAAQSLSAVSAIRFRLMVTLLVAGLLALAGTMMVGVWAARRVARREAETAHNAKVLEERNRELDAFAGRVAHDLRSPLTILHLAASQLRAKVPQESSAIRLVERGVQRMETLVDDLLTLARVEGQAPGSCDPAAVAAQIEEDFAARLEGEKGKLRVAVDHAAVSCSEGLLRQALANLTENAIKYHRPDASPEVEISGGAIDGGYDLRVSDNGLGMSPEDAGRVFEPFYRSTRTQDLPGTGLGLSIVNRVVQASGGTLSVETELGRGSTFIVHLPRADGQA